MIDKASEAFFGFMPVLPGAFSGYRWEAIQSDSSMGEYLKTQLDSNYIYKHI
jgi:chitin synthase